MRRRGGRVTGRPGGGAAIPTDLVEELDRELADTCRALLRELGRLEGLLELNRLVLDASLTLGRPASVSELFEQVRDLPGERLATLVRLLREARGP